MFGMFVVFGMWAFSISLSKKIFLSYKILWGEGNFFIEVYLDIASLLAIVNLSNYCIYEYYSLFKIDLLESIFVIIVFFV